jgi:hypothetical protein
VKLGQRCAVRAGLTSQTENRSVDEIDSAARSSVAERRTHNLLVAGSIPAGPTATRSRRRPRSSEARIEWRSRAVGGILKQTFYYSREAHESRFIATKQQPERWTPDLLAYAAGVIDSDGNIAIRFDTYAMRTRRNDYGPVYKERISVRQIEPQAVDLFTEEFGGSRFIYTPKRPGCLPLHSWQIVSRMAANVLVGVLPYLRIKRTQAELCLELRQLKDESAKARFASGGRKGSWERPEAISIRMAELRAEILRLNRADKWLTSTEREIVRRSSVSTPHP